MTPVITEIRPEDHDRWIELWAAYLIFYHTTLSQEIFDSTWKRLMAKSGSLKGFGVRETESGPLLGITHYLLHETTWSPKQMCYLEDLFVDADYRGQGLARKLIEAVASAAMELDCHECYWLTQNDNTQARILYDQVARFKGFLRYDFDYEK